MHDISDILNSFRDAMVKAGISMDGDIIPDGKIHRFHVNGDKLHSKNGWYVFYPDGIPSGSFGTWKTNFSTTWCAKSFIHNTNDEITQHFHEINIARQKRIVANEQANRKAAERAREIWEKAKPANPLYPYLVKKQISAYNLRQINNQLLVPLIDITGDLQNLQFINTDGSKYFLRGARVDSCFSLLGKLPLPSKLYLCEGFATASTIHRATKGTVVAAMNAGNLKPVAMTIRSALPKETMIIIAADNDRHTPNNPGITKGKDAANAVGAKLISPKFNCIECKCTDFNDLYICNLQNKGMPA